MIREDMVVATITEKSTPEFSDFKRRLYPARCLQIEISELLQFFVVVFRQQFDAHGSCHIHSVIFRFMLFPRLQSFAVVTKASATCRTFYRTINENMFALLLIDSYDIGFAARTFHFLKRPQLRITGA